MIVSLGHGWVAATEVNKATGLEQAGSPSGGEIVDVEVLFRGGNWSSARLSGGRTPGEGPFVVDVCLRKGEHATVQSLIDRRVLAGGLPDEFVPTVVAEIRRWADADNLLGLIRVTGGAYDPVESNQLAFRCAAQLLYLVLTDARSVGEEAERFLSAQLDAWSS